MWYVSIMARKPRISFPSALHHVVIRGNHKEKIFLDNKDKERFLTNLRIYRGRYKFMLYAYVLMENHAHLLIEEGEIPLSKIMQGIDQSYTQYYNRRYKKVGHLFQGRYKALLCDKENYLIILVRYIHLNPVRAMIVKKPEDYKWSSHNAYLTDDVGNFVDKDFVLSLFARSKSVAMKRYIEFIKDVIETDEEQDFISGNYVGNEEFTDKIEKKSQQFSREKSNISLEEIARIVTKKFDVKKRLLFEKGRGRAMSRIRGIIGLLARNSTDITLKEISHYFNRDSSTISTAIAKVEREAETDSDLWRYISEMRLQIRSLHKYQINKA